MYKYVTLQIFCLFACMNLQLISETELLLILATITTQFTSLAMLHFF
jgi:hypothetical protein